MVDLGFEWDEKKGALNKKNHGVSFTEAQTVFTDENGLLLDDPDHSHNEANLSFLAYVQIFDFWLFPIPIERMMRL